MRQDGTRNVGDGTDNGRDVPCWIPGPGESANDVARKLGLRVLGRREAGDVVAVVDNGSGLARCVAVRS